MTKPTLHAYQTRMAEFMINSTACLCWAEVGLGKTASALTAIRRLIAYGEINHALVVAPKRVAEHVWQAERDLWANDLSISLAVGTPKQRIQAITAGRHITVIGRDNVTWLVEQFGKHWPFDALILDESQSFKDPSSKRFRALKKVARQHGRVILLSATPASESLLGLWSQVYLADQGERLGKTYTGYKSAFFESDYMGFRWTPKRGAEAAIHGHLTDIAVSLRAADYLNLPERIDNPIHVYLDADEMDRYRTLEQEALLPLVDGNNIRAINAAVLFGKLAQLSGGAIYDEDGSEHVIHERKIEALKELVEGMNGQPLLVFYGYQHEKSRILNAIKGAEELNVSKWNRGEQTVAVAHAASAGAGLNLQHGGNQMAWFSLPPSLELYVQACGRLHRQGQKSTVIIHHLITVGTLDERIIDMLTHKALTQNQLLDAMKMRLQEAA